LCVNAPYKPDSFSEQIAPPPKATERVIVVLIGVLLWIVLLWFLVGLCHAARVGDAQRSVQEAGSPSHDVGAVAAAVAEREGEQSGDGAALAA
jgi:hypothetical protein